MKKLILVSLTVFALILAFGSIGAYDNNTIGFGQLVIQMGIATLIGWLSLRKLNK